MRLTCPNCGAQYEVDPSMIPPEGRDVQCSNCGQTWFQDAEPVPMTLTESVETEVVPDTVSDGDEAGPDTETQVEEPATQDAVQDADGTPDDPVEGPSPDDADDDTAPPEDEAETASAAFDPGLPRKPSEQLDDAALAMLREEAEREAEARRREQAAVIETQTEMGLDHTLEGPSEDKPSPLSAHMERMREQQAETASTAAAARSDLLPDIEEINSSLRPASEHPEVIEVQDPEIIAGRERKGFRLGFTLIIVVVALLILAYVFAPQLAEQVPQAEPALIIYVDSANSLRDGLNGLVEAALNAIGGTEGAGE